MLIFETLLGLLFGATILSVLARRLNIPYPTLLAVGGACVAFLPGAPRFELPPELILALFVAPVLVDAAYDTSLRDLRDNWQAVLSLVVVAVGLTTVAVACTARLLFPEFPWAAAIALGALVAPPDAVAALAVLRQVNPPYRLRKVLEGESLLNDASALLIYTLAVGAVMSGSFSAAGVLPTFFLTVFGSAAVGWLLAWPIGLLIEHIEDAPTSVIFQFVFTFGVWLLAERLGLSAVVTTVVFGLTAGRRSALSARLRVPTFAVWDAVTFVLNVLAFTLIGLQLGPILEALSGTELRRFLGAALIILGVVITVRLVWALTYALSQGRKSNRPPGSHSAQPSTAPPTAKGGLVIGWSGMRGIVTLATALALPQGFPERDFIQLTAFVVVLGTLVIQGLTLRPLLLLLQLPRDTTVETETSLARGAALKAALKALEGDDSEAAQRLRLEYREDLGRVRSGGDPHDTPDNMLRQRVVGASRRAIADLRHTGKIGDDAYHRVEEELDWLELSARPVSTPA
ncbi:sodium:proton antiporter (plasmid) [Deinococcus metallilatus]|uniref:CPA1 family monovalent cation:H+ antiporter n=1 Tax=Deinococcus metallilatus TaxID=1211322 RepID=A0ABR6N0C2_9DEIO|nr:sodium:proton antiporter [Deinococcus metallilatus]MBB5296951.1 CPA1 family monovalent cation:H+ antiporter [Deinococcus metallilatus]QBY06681.1 sodium:proton antiporter [Deinococcus metallilatus]GMA15150.1 sodium:proton antiporter [Deinococcus metallilatus]